MTRKAFGLGALLLLPLVLAPIPGSAQTAQQDSWASWKFLLGEWTAGDSSGAPGPASGGGFTLQPELDGRALVRRSHADYPATKDHPAFTHEDLMVVYREATAVKALYDDNEGHVIHYDVSVSADGRQIVFLSEPGEGPQFRLSYGDLGGGSVDVLFEMAPPDKPGQFAKYVEATVHRKR